MKAVAAWAAACIAPSAVAGLTLKETPITRVVKLLQDMSVKSEEEGKKEEDLYERYVCWAQSVISTKTASNVAAKARADELTAYVADLEAGRIELTSERKDLQEELADVHAEIESADALREQEHGEFQAAEAEMVAAAAALDKAVAVLAAAASGDGAEAPGDALLQGSLKDSLSFSARREESVQMARAVELGRRVLSSGDALFLTGLLTGEVPKPDWKKLNKKATFKASYKARSDKIQQVLKKMKNTFLESLQDARDKEAEAVKIHDKLTGTKVEQKEAAQAALQSMDKEGGAKGLNRQEAKEEVAALTEQVAKDEKYLAQTEEALGRKKQEWKERQKLRSAELAAFSQAISILYSDDARDLMKKSYASQGFLFLQKAQETASARRRTAAARVLYGLAGSTGDARLLSLATAAAGSRGAFDEVLASIDKMVQGLKDDEDSDLQKKEMCEKNRADDTRQSLLTSRAMDEHVETVTRLKAEIAEIEAEVKEKQETIAKTTEQVEEAGKQRKAEHADFLSSVAEDKAMHGIVVNAIGVLTKFYQDNGLMLLQQPGDGKAPPPPPSTWSEPYGGKTSAATGVITLLQSAAEDIKKDMAKAEADEKEALGAFKTFEAESTSLMEDLDSDIGTLNATKAEKGGSVVEEMGMHMSSKMELDSIMKTIKDAEPGCGFLAVHYPTRRKARQLESDGLKKAAAILKGGTFDDGPDPDREIKPGDAFLQRRRK